MMMEPRIFARKDVPFVKRSSRAGAGLFLVIASLFFCAYFPLRARAESSPCGTLSTQTVKSPDGKWNAVTREVFCENAYSFLSSATYTLALINVSKPSIKRDVFVVEDAGAVTRPKVSWSGNTTLKINTIHPVGTNLQLASYHEIILAYTYR